VPNVFAPNVFAPNVFAPNVFAPNVFAPNVFPPNIFAPNVFAPKHRMGSAITYGRETRSCLGRVFSITLSSFVSKQSSCMACTLAASRVENSVQVSSGLLKFVHHGIVL